jgi:protein tyrosine/serine phosphatase
MTDRLHKFEGIVNFRDFGGYPTQDGRSVKRHRLYRAAHFHEATEADIARLDSLGVRTLIDFRQAEEREFSPNRWRPARVIAHDRSAAPQTPPPAFDAFSAAVARANMVATYERFTWEDRFLKLFGDMFRTLAEEGGPVIVHCTAGKDRTGIACALVLHMLGVDRGAIFADYLATNTYLDPQAREALVRARIEPLLGRAITAEEMTPLIGVEAIYLEAALAEIDRRAGSIEAYVHDTLDVPEAAITAMRENLLD